MTALLFPPFDRSRPAPRPPDESPPPDEGEVVESVPVEPDATPRHGIRRPEVA